MEKSKDAFIDIFDGDKAFAHLEFMESLGPRIPDSLAHTKLENYIIDIGSKTKARFYKQEYFFNFCGKKTKFINLIYIFEGFGKNKKKILLGTHYDSRIIADREENPDLKNKPIPGINDGGSGTAVFLEFLQIFDKYPLEDDICIVFFDAEDIGLIDGYNFSEGAEYFAENFTEFKPDEVIIIDMIGGRDATYQVDYGALVTLESKFLLTEIWKCGLFLEFPQFSRNVNFDGSFFVCDHTPFVNRDIPAMLLIDINYKWWHTQGDIVKNCSSDSLEAAGKTLLFYLYKLGESIT